MNNKIEIPISKKKILLLLFAAVAFVVGGIWIASNPESFILNIFRFNNLEIIRIVSIVGILFFVACGIYGIKKLLDKRVVFIIDSNGITDNSNASSVGLIKWNDILQIRTMQVMSTKFILIDTANPQEYIEKTKNVLQSKLMKVNMNIYETPLSISSNTLKYNFLELEKLIQTEFKRNKKVE